MKVSKLAAPLLMVATLLSSTAALGTEVGVPALPTSHVKDGQPHVCTVSCTDPHACCSESQKVLEVLQKLITAYSTGDLQTYEKYLDDKCMVVDELDHKVISGKPAILERLKADFATHAPGGKSPLLSFHIDQPFAKVNDKGDTCVVTFVATKDVGGSYPHSERANVTDIFVKRAGEWKKLHWQGKWEPVSDTK